MAWYNTNWQYREKITIDNGKVSADLTDYPVYLDLSELGTDFFDNVKSGGGDIRMTTSDGETEVPREIVSCDTTEETGEVHFKGDLSGSTDTDFYVYYGNSEASDYAITATYGAENVWNSNYKAVYHMKDADDSTSNSNDGTVTGATSGATGKIEDAYSFDGVNDYISLPLRSLYATFTQQAWVKTTSVSPIRQYLLSIQKDPPNSSYNTYQQRQGFFLGYDTVQAQYWSGSGVYGLTTAAGEISANTFYKIDFTGGSSGGKLYVNGSVKNTVVGVPSTSIIPTEAYIGLRGDAHGNDRLSGIVDELRVLSSELSADWLSTEYNNQSSPSTFYTIGSQEESKVLSNTIFLSNNF